MREVAAADILQSPPDGLLLYSCLCSGGPACLGSFRPDTEFAGTHSVRLMHCWYELYRSSKLKVDVEQLCIGDTYSCRLGVAPSRIWHSNAGLDVSVTKTFSSGDGIGPYYEATAYHDLSSRHSTRNIYESGALRLNVAGFSNYALQLRVQRRRFDRNTERLGNGEGNVLPSRNVLCICVY